MTDPDKTKGSKGPRGTQGNQSKEVGPTGNKGLAGPKGPIGPQGNQLVPGPKGLKGIKGPTGLKGPKGRKGPQGPIGPRGPRGLTGPTGPAGFKGNKGIKGPAGAQCYKHDVAYITNRELRCENCESNAEPCGSKSNLSIYSPTSGALSTGSYAYSDSACEACNFRPNKGECVFDTETGIVTIWDQDHANNEMHHWLQNDSKNPCILKACADCELSDERMKSGIKTITNSLNTLLKIEVTEYDWNDKYSGYDYLSSRQKLHSIGMIAQEIQKIYPEVVYKRSDGYYAIKYFKLNALIIEAIKSHQVFIDDMDEQIKWLKTYIN